MIARGWALVPLLALSLAGAAHAAADETGRLRREAAEVTIVRDDWGIAHIHGRTDAQAVFGMIYAQAEDDFGRIEANYATGLGRAAEADGEGALWQDLRQRLFVDPEDLKAKYAVSPAWLKALMAAWADGLNYYLATHPDVRPRVIGRFEPWMALSFSEGSIGGDIETVSLKDLEGFYGRSQTSALSPREDLASEEPGGSNGFAIGPSITRDGHALLLINPHTSFYFRSEQQVTSDQGLDVYGAATWGQFFIYQGFNARAGWMHTTTSADAVDEFAETIVRQGGRLFYRYGGALRPVAASTIVLDYRAAGGGLAHRTFTVWRTHHGPIVRAAGGKWIAVALMQRSVQALEQSFLRTKTQDLASFLKVAALAANSSNDTVFADSKGETALLLPQFIPLRDNRFDYTRPVDGSNPATDWKGVTPLDSLPRVINPSGGWLYNSNDGPWWAAGPDSPRKADFPRYMDQIGENPRTPHDLRVLNSRKDFTLASLIQAAFDPWLPAFARLVPRLVADYDAMDAGDPLKARLAGPVEALRGWDDRWSADSVPTTLAVLWGDTLRAETAPGATGNAVNDYMAVRAAPAQRLAALARTVDRLDQDFGNWKIPWGEVNRFQRIDDAIAPRFDDAKPSLPAPFVYSQWGSLASFAARRYPGTRRYYGSAGNSFVAVVEFGDRVRARAVSAGGQSGDPASPHFADQASRYVAGDLREVYFYPDQLVGHTIRGYHPGE